MASTSFSEKYGSPNRFKSAVSTRGPGTFVDKDTRRTRDFGTQSNSPVKTLTGDPNRFKGAENGNISNLSALSKGVGTEISSGLSKGLGGVSGLPGAAAINAVGSGIGGLVGGAFALGNTALKAKLDQENWQKKQDFENSLLSKAGLNPALRYINASPYTVLDATGRGTFLPTNPLVAERTQQDPNMRRALGI